MAPPVRRTPRGILARELAIALPLMKPFSKAPPRFEASADGAEFGRPTDSEDFEIWRGRWSR